MTKQTISKDKKDKAIVLLQKATDAISIFIDEKETETHLMDLSKAKKLQKELNEFLDEEAMQ